MVAWFAMLALDRALPHLHAVPAAARRQSLGLSRLQAVAGALATGLVEPLGAALGVLAIVVSAVALPVALGLAAGALFGAGFLAIAAVVGSV